MLYCLYGINSDIKVVRSIHMLYIYMWTLIVFEALKALAKVFFSFSPVDLDFGIFIRTED